MTERTSLSLSWLWDHVSEVGLKVKLCICHSNPCQCISFVFCCGDTVHLDFWFFSKENYSICRCKFVVPMGVGEFRFFLCHHCRCLSIYFYFWKFHLVLFFLFFIFCHFFLFMSICHFIFLYIFCIHDCIFYFFKYLINIKLMAIFVFAASLKKLFSYKFDSL